MVHGNRRPTLTSRTRMRNSDRDASSSVSAHGRLGRLVQKVAIPKTREEAALRPLKMGGARVPSVRGTLTSCSRHSSGRCA